MKKIKLTIAGLLLAGFSYSQAQDTICHAVAGKIHFEFDYYKSKIVNKTITEDFEDIIIEIKKNQVLYVDLYDDCACNKYQDANKERQVRVYYRNGHQTVYLKNSGNLTLKFITR